MNRTFLTLKGEILDLLAVTTDPLAEKLRSEGALVAGIANNIFASLDNCGKTFEFFFHHFSIDTSGSTVTKTYLATSDSSESCFGRGVMFLSKSNLIFFQFGVVSDEGTGATSCTHQINIKFTLILV